MVNQRLADEKVAGSNVIGIMRPACGTLSEIKSNKWFGPRRSSSSEPTVSESTRFIKPTIGLSSSAENHQRMLGDRKFKNNVRRTAKAWNSRSSLPLDGKVVQRPSHLGRSFCFSSGKAGWFNEKPTFTPAAAPPTPSASSVRSQPPSARSDSVHNRSTSTVSDSRNRKW